MKINLLKQIGKFGIVGGMAAVVNLLVEIGLVENHWLTPLSANIFAFLIAFQVSYFGHRYWTFADTKASHPIALSKLFLIGSINLGLNELLFLFFLTVTHLSYPIALVLVLTILPISTFIINKFWVFK